MDEYLSCPRGTARIEIERSVFVADVSPAENEAEAAAFIAGIRAAHPDATHHCYAYLCDAEQNVFRFSDDGEPAKTAGLPILEALRGRKLFNIVVVVTRWFGGVKLGAGGLVRAYARAALAAADAAGTRKFERASELVVRCGYDALPRIESYLKLRGREARKEFGERITVRFFERAREADGVLAELADLTGGRAEGCAGTQRFVCFDRDGNNF